MDPTRCFNWKTSWPHAVADISKLNVTDDPAEVTCFPCYWALGRPRLRDKVEHECMTKPLCDGWPYGVDDAYRTIAAVANPGERKENRDGWAVTMRHRPELFEQEAARARERLEAAIAHGRAAVEPLMNGEGDVGDAPGRCV